MSDASNMDRVVQLERADATKLALEDAANQLEQLRGNETYERAWRQAADFIRLIIFKKDKTT